MSKQEVKIRSMLYDLKYVRDVARALRLCDKSAIKRHSEMLARRQKSPGLRNVLLAIVNSSDQIAAINSAEIALAWGRK